MPLRVVYFGTYREEYSRNRIMQQALRSAGVEVIECHERLWSGAEERVRAASGGWIHPGFIFRLLGVYARLLWRGLHLREYDLLMCGYPGQLDVFLGWLISHLHHKPLVWDVFMSIYLIALERGLDRKSALSVGLLRRLEWLALQLPNRLVQDTRQYVTWLCKTYGVAPDIFCLAPTSADERMFKSEPRSTDDGIPAGKATFQVLYYGSFIPNHHTPTIVKAAALLTDRPEIRFEMIGDGPELPAVQRLARSLGLTRVSFTPWLDSEVLAAKIRQADLLLGAFGDTPQSMMTVHNKVYEGLASGIPVLTGDSEAIREAFQVGEEILVCARKSPEALAEAVRCAADDPPHTAQVGLRGHAAFCKRYTFVVIGERLKACLVAVMERTR